MKHTISPDRQTLTMSIDKAEQTLLAMTLQDEELNIFDIENQETETLLANSDLQWINPEDTGDLTDAPMLGITGEDSREESGPYGAIHTGGDEQGPIFAPILERWAFMDYAVRSFLDDLATNGKALFTAH